MLVLRKYPVVVLLLQLCSLAAISVKAYTNPTDKHHSFSIVTNNPICTDIAVNYHRTYPKITAIELFIVASICEGIVHPMDSGLGGGFQMLAVKEPNEDSTHPFARYINAREMSGAVVPTTLGRTPQHIGVPSMLAGYQYIYQNLHRWNLTAALPWYMLFEENIKLARHGFVMSQSLRNALHLVSVSSIWILYNRQSYAHADMTHMRNPTLASFLQSIANQNEMHQSIYAEHTMDHKIMSNELSSMNTHLTGIDLLDYTVRGLNAPSTLLNDLSVYATKTPGSGLLLIFACNMFNVAYFKYNYLRWHEIDRFKFRIHLMYYVYSLSVHLNNLNSNQIVTLIKRDAPEIARQIVRNLNASIPTTIAKRFGQTVLPVNRIINTESVHHGGSNVCVNKDGLYLCATSSINWSFGSGFYSRYFGIFYNNQLSDFTFNNSLHANSPKAHKQPQSYMVPTIFLDNKTKKFEFSIGATGGSKAIGSIINVFDILAHQRATKQRYNCMVAIESPRCYYIMRPTVDNVLMQIACEQHLSQQFQYALRQLKQSIHFSTIAHGAVTTNIKDQDGCYDSRQGGKTFYEHSSHYRHTN